MNPLARLGLIVAYSILALAALGRSSYQVGTKFADAPVPYAVSAASAVLYLAIAVCLWRGWTGAALIGSAIELFGVVTVGTLGYVEPTWWPDETVWTGYGSAYGWVPLLLPAVALWALISGRRRGTAAPMPGQSSNTAT